MDASPFLVRSTKATGPQKAKIDNTVPVRLAISLYMAPIRIILTLWLLSLKIVRKSIILYYNNKEH